MNEPEIEMLFCLPWLRVGLTAGASKVVTVTLEGNIFFLRGVLE